MCKCEQPHLKPKEGKCGEKQIKECHGDKGEHPCEKKNETK